MKLTIPGEPVAKARPKFARAGKFVRTYTPEKSLNYEQTVAYYAAQALAGLDTQAYKGPVKLKIDFFFSRPKSRQRVKLRGKVTPRTVKPDADNLVKSILDGLNKVAFKDDAQVYDIRVGKYEVDTQARTEIEITHGEGE